MAFEVACSQCQGRLMVEQAGVIVACPHCGAHLTIEAPAEVATPQQDADSASSEDQPAAPSTAEALQQPTHTDPEVTAPIVAPFEPGTAESTVPSIGQASDAASNNADRSGGSETLTAAAEIPGEQMPYLGNAPIQSAGDDSSSNETPADTVAAAFPISADPAAIVPAEATPVTTQSAPANSGYGEGITVSSVASVRGVSRQTFALLRNYAIAVTIAVIILVVRMLNPNTSALESLPDVKPPKKDDRIVYKLVPEATEMPPGHVLSLGQPQRFGNLKVTPVRVTHDPVEFVHHMGDKGVTREPSPKVMKLWFEFENVSSDQSIAPLDGLVFRRDDNDWENVRSNNFVCRQSEKKKGGELVFVYGLNESDIWDLRGQNVEQEIAPGEKLETYIPTSEEGLAQLLSSDEPLIWRVHFRKGYSRKNYGVTTVIEVAFESSDIGVASTTPDEISETTEST